MVVDVGMNLEETDDVRLVRTHGMKATYTTLSYCWGGVDFIRTTTNLERHFYGIKFNALPQTFQEAVVICRRLDVQFLWIDALCIVQDDKEDFARELGRMCTIYEQALFTIAASSSKNPSEGCFHVSHPDYRTHQLDVRSSRGQYRVHFRQDLHNSNYSGREDPVSLHILTRGWVLQERLLSRRILYFDKNEVLWECKEAGWCECSYPQSFQPFMLPDNRPRLKTNIAQMLNEKGNPEYVWAQLVRAYSGCTLTKPSDILPALSGIAEYVQRYRSKSRYVAGLWSDSLQSDLLWVNYNKSSQRAYPWRAPTWSWASVVDTDFGGGGYGDGKFFFRRHIVGMRTHQPGKCNWRAGIRRSASFRAFMADRDGTSEPSCYLCPSTTRSPDRESIPCLWNRERIQSSWVRESLQGCYHHLP
jgi:hypothetical protein